MTTNRAATSCREATFPALRERFRAQVRERISWVIVWQTSAGFRPSKEAASKADRIAFTRSRDRLEKTVHVVRIAATTGARKKTRDPGHDGRPPEPPVHSRISRLQPFVERASLESRPNTAFRSVCRRAKRHISNDDRIDDARVLVPVLSFRVDRARCRRNLRGSTRSGNGRFRLN